MESFGKFQSHAVAGPICSPVPAIDQLVINWHLTEACNYSCRYCFSRWEKKQTDGELFFDKGASLQLLRELYRFFSPGNASNPLSPHLKWNNLRLSLAGGETLLYPQRTVQISSEAKDLGFKVSLITNASLMSYSELDPLFGNLSMLGISLDSADPKTCRQIGRVDKADKILTLDDHLRTIDRVRSINPEIVLKVNTVVNKFNVNENLTELIERLNPDKWKILRVLPFVSDELDISEQQFQSFVDRHKRLGAVLSVENNRDMTESYLMLNPLGRFFQNQSNIQAGHSYTYSQPILQVGADAAFRQINFDATKFIARYSKDPMEVAA